MILYDEDVAEYQALVKKRHGIEISKSDALEDALSLINFVKLCVKAKERYGNKKGPEDKPEGQMEGARNEKGSAKSSLHNS